MEQPTSVRRHQAPTPTHLDDAHGVGHVGERGCCCRCGCCCCCCSRRRRESPARLAAVAAGWGRGTTGSSSRGGRGRGRHEEEEAAAASAPGAGGGGGDAAQQHAVAVAGCAVLCVFVLRVSRPWVSGSDHRSQRTRALEPRHTLHRQFALASVPSVPLGVPINQSLDQSTNRPLLPQSNAPPGQNSHHATATTMPCCLGLLGRFFSHHAAAAAARPAPARPGDPTRAAGLGVLHVHFPHGAPAAAAYARASRRRPPPAAPLGRSGRVVLAGLWWLALGSGGRRAHHRHGRHRPATRRAGAHHQQPPLARGLDVSVVLCCAAPAPAVVPRHPQDRPEIIPVVG